MTRLPPPLSDLPERLQRTNRGAGAEFFGKLASGDLLWIIRGIHLALRNDQAPLSFLRRSGPPGLTSSTSSPLAPLW